MRVIPTAGPDQKDKRPWRKGEMSRALHNRSLTSKAIGAPFGGPSLAEKAVPTPTPIAPHGHSLQYIVSIIKNSQQRNPAQQNE